MRDAWLDIRPGCVNCPRFLLVLWKKKYETARSTSFPMTDLHISEFFVGFVVSRSSGRAFTRRGRRHGGIVTSKMDTKTHTQLIPTVVRICIQGESENDNYFHRNICTSHKNGRKERRDFRHSRRDLNKFAARRFTITAVNNVSITKRDRERWIFI